MCFHHRWLLFFAPCFCFILKCVSVRCASALEMGKGSRQQSVKDFLCRFVHTHPECICEVIFVDRFFSKTQQGYGFLRSRCVCSLQLFQSVFFSGETPQILSSCRQKQKYTDAEMVGFFFSAGWVGWRSGSVNEDMNATPCKLWLLHVSPLAPNPSDLKLILRSLFPCCHGDVRSLQFSTRTTHNIAVFPSNKRWPHNWKFDCDDTLIPDSLLDAFPIHTTHRRVASHSKTKLATWRIPRLVFVPTCMDQISCCPLLTFTSH